MALTNSRMKLSCVQQRVSRVRWLVLSNRKHCAVRQARSAMAEGDMDVWSDLPPDILRSVASRLELVDQIRFRAVCKSWHQIGEEVEPEYKLPWVFVLNPNRKPPHYYLYDLSHRKLYGVSVRRLSTRMYLGICMGGFESMYILCVKMGWLVINPFFRETFLLFNPFSQKIIFLPNIPRHLLLPLRFSHSPTLCTLSYCRKSRSLAVYATNPRITDGVVIINTWRSGDRKWESYSFAAESPGVMNRMLKIELVGEEALYCIFETGVVGCFDVCRRSWSVVVEYSGDNELFSRVTDSFHRYSCAFEFRGELLIMDVRFGEFVIWRLDQSEGRWERVGEFHKCAIFGSEYKPLSVLCSEQFVASSDAGTTRIHYFKHPFNDRITTMNYNHDDATSDGLDPFQITSIRFPWSPSKSFPLWIEPALSPINTD